MKVLEQLSMFCDHFFVEFLCEQDRLAHPRLRSQQHQQMDLKKDDENVEITAKTEHMKLESKDPDSRMSMLKRSRRFTLHSKSIQINN